MKRYFRKLGAGVAGIFNFNGRMALHDFWPYAITIVLVLYGLGMLLGLWVQFEIAQRIGMGVWAGGVYDPVIVEQQPEQIFSLMTQMLGYFVPYAAISLALHVIPLAAASARRLHDAGRTGWWASLPLPFSAWSIYQFDRAFSRFPDLVNSRPEDSAIFAFVGEIFIAVGASLLSLVAGIVLIVLLCGKGRPEPNTYGPPPIPIQ